MFEDLAQDATIVLTLLLLEAVLSFDNAAILAAMVRKLPVKDRKKALLYGLVGAYTLRFAAILLASFLTLAGCGEDKPAPPSATASAPRPRARPARPSPSPPRQPTRAAD